MTQHFDVQPGIFGTETLYYSDSDQEHRCVGHVRGGFGHGGNEYYASFWPHQGADQADEAFHAELNALVVSLRKSLLKDRPAMRRYIQHHPTLVLEAGDLMSYGYRVETDRRVYYIRCTPHPGVYDFYIYAYRRERAV